jgi:hypothetical protein
MPVQLAFRQTVHDYAVDLAWTPMVCLLEGSIIATDANIVRRFSQRSSIEVSLLETVVSAIHVSPLLAKWYKEIFRPRLSPGLGRAGHSNHHYTHTIHQI